MTFNPKPTSQCSAVYAPKTIKDYLCGRGISIESTAINEEKYNNAGLSSFAERLAALQPDGNAFLKYVRTLINQKKNKCYFLMNRLTEKERAACIEVANIFCSVGILTGAMESNGILTGNFNFTTRSISFINGEFLEIAIFNLTKRFIEKYADTHSLPAGFEVLPNVIASSATRISEYDILFRVDTEFYVIEVKSGKAEDFPHYKAKGLELGLFPKHQMIVTGDRTDSEMGALSYFEEVSVCDYHSFLLTLDKMISKENSDT